MTAFFSGSINLKKLVVVLIMSASLWLALFVSAFAEEITSFDVDYEIRSDSSVLVTETITYDFGSLQKHGIFRNVKNKHPQKASAWYKERYVDISLLFVTRDGVSEPYTLESYDGMSAKIGRAESTITGSHVYKIVYELKGALSEYPDGVEFYWNVIGDEWPVAINNIEVRVHTSPDNYLSNQLACYAGVSGSNSKCDQNKLIEKMAVFEQATVSSGQDMTIAQSLSFTGENVVLERVSLFWLIIPTIIILVIGLVFFGYRWKYEFKVDDPVIAQYEPLEEFGPLLSGVLVDQVVDSRDITASIIFLAQQGFISIKQIEKVVIFGFKVHDYEVALLKPINETKSNFHRTILELLFSEYSETGTTIILSNIKKDRSRLIKNGKNISLLKNAIKEDLLESGYFEVNKTPVLKTMSILGVGIFLAIILFSTTGKIDGFVFLLGIFAVVIIAVFTTTIYKRRTKTGYQVLNYLRGFKDFLSVTEKDRYRFHNAPSLSPQKFMDYLPYAIAFGVEEQWAEVFKDMHIDTPDWYSSGTNEPFSSGVLVGSLSSFSSSLVGATSAPNSSGSGGSGSSGGGGGGGGGGSW